MVNFLWVLGMVALMVILGFIVWWLLFASEGVYLGRKTVIWLYDRFAQRYDHIKQYQTRLEHTRLSRPLMAKIAPHKTPRILDVATGTGRLPLALLQHARFNGQVVGLDLSYAMLQAASAKLAEFYGDAPMNDSLPQVDLLCADASTLPFTAGAFDVVTCLEALEFTPYPEKTLAELARVLRAGGLLLLSNRINTPWMPSRIWSQATMTTKLAALGFPSPQFEVWLTDYQLIWATKDGTQQRIGRQALTTNLCCPHCGQQRWQTEHKAYVCKNCAHRLISDVDGILRLT